MPDRPHQALPITRQDIENAHKAISAYVQHTPARRSITLSKMLGAEIWLKFENLQFTGAYKERGALHRLLQLSPEQKQRGVIAMSAGNHAQGVAYHASRLGIPATIVMPKATPAIKVEGTRVHGARIILHGDIFEEAAAFAARMAEDERLTFIHPFDDPAVIAGQGTIAIEYLADVPDLDCLILPIGGGGMISGMSIYAHAINPDIDIVGVQAELYPSMRDRMRGELSPCGGSTLAEGIAVKTPGEITSKLVSALVDDIVLVDEARLESAVSLLLNIEKTVVEGAGAAGLAAVLAYPERFRGRKLGLVLTGGNIDTRLLADILYRELAREGRLGRIRVELADQPGQLATLSKLIADQGANVIEVVHQRRFSALPAKGAYVVIELETRGREHLDTLITVLRENGMRVDDLAPDIV